MKGLKKVIIKSLSVMLAVVLTLTAAPLSGFVGLELPEWLDFSIMSSAAETSGTCGENLSWTFDESMGTLIISGTGAMINDGYGYEDTWNGYDDNIKSVIINDGVTSIGDGSFKDFNNLTSVTIGEDVTIIGFNAFRDCVNLKNIVIPNGVNTIGKYAFDGCESLENITIGSGVQSIGEDALYWCDSLINIIVDSNNQYYSSDKYGALFDKEKTMLIQYPKANDQTSYVIPNSVIEISDGAFARCPR